MNIGLAGSMGSGKGESVRLLLNKGFRGIILSDFVKEELTKRGLPLTRMNLMEVGNSLRQQFGNSYLAERAKLLMKDNDQDYVIDGLRHPDEIDSLREVTGFRAVAIIASRDVSINRIRTRGRIEDGQISSSLDEIMDCEQGVNQPFYGLQLKKCIEMCEFTINGDLLLSEFIQEFSKLIEKIKSK